MEKHKLKILCLHGYRQSGDIFKSKIGSFRKIVQKYAEFTFITAPHKVNNVINNDVEAQQDKNLEDVDEKNAQYGWWFNRDDITFKGDREGGPAIGFDETTQLIEKVFNEQGPFDGVLGFSQGACLAGIIMHLQSIKRLRTDFKFAVMVAGFCSGSTPHLGFYQDEHLIDCPSLHVFGETDNIIPSTMSLKLLHLFEDTKSTRVAHAGGHFFPASSNLKVTYVEFMRDQLIKKLEEDEMKNANKNNTVLC